MAGNSSYNETSTDSAAEGELSKREGGWGREEPGGREGVELDDSSDAEVPEGGAVVGGVKDMLPVAVSPARIRRVSPRRVMAADWHTMALVCPSTLWKGRNLGNSAGRSGSGLVEAHYAQPPGRSVLGDAKAMTRPAGPGTTTWMSPFRGQSVTVVLPRQPNFRQLVVNGDFGVALAVTSASGPTLTL
jgi:hypothetical protein